MSEVRKRLRQVQSRRRHVPEERTLCAARGTALVNGEGGLFAFNSISQGVLLGAPASHHAKRCAARKGSHGQVWEILDLKSTEQVSWLPGFPACHRQMGTENLQEEKIARPRLCKNQMLCWCPGAA